MENKTVKPKSLEEWIEEGLKKGKTDAERKKFLEESTLKALWKIKELLEKQTPPLEERNYQTITYSYTLLNVERCFDFPGNFFYYARCYVTVLPDGYGDYNNLPLYIKLDDSSAEEIRLLPGQVLKAPYRKLYINAKLVAGVSVNFVIGRNLDFFTGSNLNIFRDNTNRTATALIDAAGHIQTDIIGSLPAGVNNIGDVDVLSLPSLPAGANNIGDVDVLSLPSIPAGTDTIGNINILHNKNLWTAPISIAAMGDNVVIAALAPDTVSRYFIYAITFVAAGIVNIILKDGAGVNLTGAMPFVANQRYEQSVTPPGYLWRGSAYTAFIINLSANIGVYGIVHGWSE